MTHRRDQCKLPEEYVHYKTEKGKTKQNTKQMREGSLRMTAKLFSAFHSDQVGRAKVGSTVHWVNQTISKR